MRGIANNRLAWVLGLLLGTGLALIVLSALGVGGIPLPLAVADGICIMIVLVAARGA